MPAANFPARRITLIHALRASIAPVHAAFARHWPEAAVVDVFDGALATDVVATGSVTQSIVNRFLVLGRSALNQVRAPDAILFTCSAFAVAIDAVARDLPIPVHGPTAAAFEQALAMRLPIHLLVTFGPSLSALLAELRALAAARSVRIELHGHLVEGALEQLQSGNHAEHSRLIVRAAIECAPDGVVVLGQFSMASVASDLPESIQSRVLTTPDSAVIGLRRSLIPKSQHGVVA